MLRCLWRIARCDASSAVNVLQRQLFIADQGLTIDLSAHMNAVWVDPVNLEVLVQG